MENKKIKALLVEDDTFLRDICSKKLRNEGMEVIEKKDGEEAIKALEEESVDIILLDIILPSMDGFEVLKRIRENKKENIRKTPVIMLSNLGQEDDIEKAMSIGANDFLIKAHFTTGEIVQKMKKVLRQNSEE